MTACRASKRAFMDLLEDWCDRTVWPCQLAGWGSTGGCSGMFMHKKPSRVC